MLFASICLCFIACGCFIIVLFEIYYFFWYFEFVSDLCIC